MAETVYSKLYTENKIKEAERKQKIEYNNLLKEQERQEQERANASFWDKAGATVADMFTELGGGLLKLVEGVVDAGVGIGGAVGGIFGADTDWAEDIIKFDATQEWYYGAFEDELTKNSVINDIPVVKDIVRGIGQQLPTIVAFALAIPTDGASLAAVPYTVGATIASAGGGGVEEALNEDAEFGESFAYGLMQAGIEGGVEALTAGMGKGITSLGKATGKGVTKTAVKSVGKAMLEETISEAAEEGISALVNPLTKTVYQGKEALDAYKDMSFYMDAAQQTFVGGVVGGISGGISGRLAKSYTMNDFKKKTNISTYTNENYNILQSQSELNTLDIKEDNLRKNGKMNEKKLAEMKKAKNAEYEYISENLKKMDIETRSKVMEKLDLDGLFDGDGNINQDTINANKNNNLKQSEIKKAEQTLKDAQDIYNKKYEMSHNGEKSDVKIDFDNDVLDSVEDRNFASMKSAIRAIGEKSGTRLGIALIKTNAQDIQGFKDNGNIYITRQSLKDGTWAKPVAHETFHFLQNNDAGKQLTNFLKSNESEFTKAKDRVLNENYGVNQKDIDNAFEKIKNNEKLTDNEQLALDEVGASMVENVLGNEQSIKRICMQNTNLASKILNKIKYLIKLFTGTTAERTQLKLLNTAEKLFTKSMAETKEFIYQWEKKTSKNFEQYLKDKEKYLSLKENQKEEWLKNHGYKAEDFNDDILESYDDKVQFDSEQENEYNKNEIRYSKRKTYLSYNKVGIDNVNSIRNELNKIYNNVKDGIADGIAIEKGENVYVIDTGKDNGNISFGVIKALKISDKNLRKSYVKELNNDAISKGYVSDEISSKIGDKYDNDRGSNRGQKLGEKLSDNSKQSSNNKRGISKDNGNRGNRGLNFSLKETVEQDVIKEYGKTYNWNETGYILTDGSRLDMSGRKEGAPGGYRNVDHREIFGENSGTESMIEFMSRGNIRVIPEYPGINLQVEPNAEQYNQIEKLIETLGWKNKEFMVDFDNANGDTIDSLSYEGGNVRASKIIEDIKYYFKEGKLPYKSDLSQFRYSLDSNGNKLTLDQANYFKNSKVRDKDGNLLVMYHGTSSYFNTFESGYGGLYGAGMYFTEDISYADNYTHGLSVNGKSVGGRIISAYLNIENPLVIDNVKDLDDVYYKASRKEIQENGITYTEKIQDFDFGKWLRENYDGVIINKPATDQPDVNMKGKFCVAFNSNQIKLTDNKKPTLNEDIRYSLNTDEDTNIKGGLTKAQRAKFVANNTKMKVYSRADAEITINDIIANRLNLDDQYIGEITGKTKNQAIDYLFQQLNGANENYRGSVALKIADYIIENTTLVDTWAEFEINDSNKDTSRAIVEYLNTHRHDFNLKSLKGEINRKYSGKESGIYMHWSAKNGGFGVDQIAQEMQSLGLHQFKATNDADIFFEMMDVYKDAQETLNKKIDKLKLKEFGSEEKINNLRQEIARDVLMAYDEKGTQSKYGQLVEKYTRKISQLKQEVKDLKAHNIAKNNFISTIERLKDEFIKSKPAGWNVPEQVVRFVKEVSNIETWRNNISKNARIYLRDLLININTVMDDTQKSIYPYKEAIEEIVNGSGELTTDELKTLDYAFRQFAWQLKNYDKVVFEDRVQSNTDLATQGVYETKKAQKILKNNGNILARFANYVYVNPSERLSQMGLYSDNSIAKRMYKDMLDGDRKRARIVMETNNLFNEFFKENKSYLKELQKEITVDGITLTKRQALSLYCTSLREQGKTHLFNEDGYSGVIHILDNKLSTQGKMVEAFSKGEDVKITQDTIFAIQKTFTNADIEYLKLVDQFFNKLSKNAKQDTDKKLYGISNVEDGYYFPIKVSSDKIFTEAGQNNQNVNQYILNLGMNKTVKPKANNKIVIDGIDNVISNHLQGLSLYYGYAVPLTAYNRIMNKQISVIDTDPTANMRGELQKIDPSFDKFMNRLWQDVQGIKRTEDNFASWILSRIRWAGANAALGLNPKVLVTQTTSLASAVSEFNAKYIAKGMGHFFGEAQKLELSKYSPLMWERMEIGNSVDITEVRQIGKEVGNRWGKIASKITKAVNTITTKPISWMDSNVIQSLWFAAQYEVADKKGKGFEFGTEANKIEAGKRLDEVVFKTQQTSDPLGRSDWMRSQNEFVKFTRMFTGDSIQLVGRLISSVNKVNVAKRMIKSGDVELIEQGQKLLKTSRKDLAKAGSAFALNQLMLLAIAMGFKWLKGKDDDEEWEDVAKNEVIANLMGLIPLGGDIYDKLSGYEPTNMAYTALSNSIEIAVDLYNNGLKVITGEYQDPVKRRYAWRKTILSLSRLFGVPLQNLESYGKGILGHISPSTREEYEALFKTKSNVQYLNKIRKATEDGNEDLAETIINIMFKSRTGKIKDDNVLDTTRNLIEAGYDVIPKSVGTSITYDGVQYTLTNKQHTQFTKIYSQANEKIKTLVNNSTFNKLEDVAKAKAMNFVYDYYYNLAIEDMLGEDLETKNILFAEAIPIEQLAIAVAQARTYESDVVDGKVVTGSKKTKISTFVQSLRLTATQKYMIMGYLGYTNKYGDSLVKTYINRLNLTKSQKEQLYQMSGYAA